jgi:hypothetical protein
MRALTGLVLGTVFFLGGVLLGVKKVVVTMLVAVRIKNYSINLLMRGTN